MTAVINASAAGVIETAHNRRQIGKVYAGRDGIVGALSEDLIDTSRNARPPFADCATPRRRLRLRRHKLKGLEKPRRIRTLIEVFKAHNIGYFFYNGGGDSMDTA